MKRPTSRLGAVLFPKEAIIAVIAVMALGIHLILRYGFKFISTFYGITWPEIPVLLSEYLASTPVVLILSDGQARVRDHRRLSSSKYVADFRDSSTTHKLLTAVRN